MQHYIPEEITIRVSPPHMTSRTERPRNIVYMFGFPSQLSIRIIRLAPHIFGKLSNC
jgi:hypothetical protein